MRPGFEVMTLSSCSTQLSMKLIMLINVKFIMLINVKMPTSVGILTFLSMINTISEGYKAKKSLFFSILVFISS